MYIFINFAKKFLFRLDFRCSCCIKGTEKLQLCFTNFYSLIMESKKNKLEVIKANLHKLANACIDDKFKATDISQSELIEMYCFLRAKEMSILRFRENKTARLLEFQLNYTRNQKSLVEDTFCFVSGGNGSETLDKIYRKRLEQKKPKAAKPNPTIKDLTRPKDHAVAVFSVSSSKFSLYTGSQNAVIARLVSVLEKEGLWRHPELPANFKTSLSADEIRRVYFSIRQDEFICSCIDNKDAESGWENHVRCLVYTRTRVLELYQRTSGETGQRLEQEYNAWFKALVTVVPEFEEEVRKRIKSKVFCREQFAAASTYVHKYDIAARVEKKGVNVALNLTGLNDVPGNYAFGIFDPTDRQEIDKMLSKERPRISTVRLFVDELRLLVAQCKCKAVVIDKNLPWERNLSGALGQAGIETWYAVQTDVATPQWGNFMIVRKVLPGYKAV